MPKSRIVKEITLSNRAALALGALVLCGALPLAGSLMSAGPLGATAWAAPGTPAEAALTQGPGGEINATEETAAVERAIESKVRDILDGVIKPDQYAVYVQANLKADAAILKAYYDERALTTLPGIPSPDQDASSPTNNKLYSMVRSRKVIVVLDKAVTADQELVTKEILKAKLSLNDKKGDVLDIRRSEVPASADRALASAPAAHAATESWVKLGLIGLAAALALAMGLLLWQVSLLRERVDARAKVSADFKLDSNSNVNASGGPAAEGAEGAEAEDRSRDIRESDPISAVELKEKILALAVSQPKSCSLVARKLMATREGMRKLAVACEAIGFEYTKQLFDTVSPAKWRAMGEYLRSNLQEVSKAPVGPILLEIYTEMLAESMGWDPAQSGDGPFDFLHKIGEEELTHLLGNQEPSHIAFIAGYWEPEEMSQVLAALPESKRKETILQIARLRALPREVVQQAAVRFAERIKALRARNEKDVDGSQVVARMLDTVDSGTEEELLRFIEREDPATRDRLRAHYFSFDSVHLVPAEVLASVFENMDPQAVTQALVGAPEAIVAAVLGVMPPKQRAIIEDDVKVAAAQGTIAKADVSTARKQIVVELRKAMKDRGIELAHLAGGGGGEAGAGIAEAATQTGYRQERTSPGFAVSEASPAVAEPYGSSAEAALAQPMAVAEAQPAEGSDVAIAFESDDDKAA